MIFTLPMLWTKSLKAYMNIIHLSLVLLTKSLRTMQLRKGMEDESHWGLGDQPPTYTIASSF